jgi:signal transduction histidine kinase
MVLAQNHLASGEAHSEAAAWGASTRHDLGEGVVLQLWSTRENGAPHVAVGVLQNDISTLANSMAHSIRNPLSSIVTAAKLIGSDEGVSEETRMLLDVVQKESKQLDFLLTDFLHYVRPQKLSLVTLDIRKLVVQTLAKLQREGVLTPSIEVVNTLPDELLVHADEVQIARSLHNIVRNAAQSMPEGGTLEIRGEYSPREVHLTISDSGSGFSSEDLQRAFEPFYANTPEGAGLGLSIACDSVARCGGTLRLENALDEHGKIRGARVLVMLPRTEKPDVED